MFGLFFWGGVMAQKPSVSLILNYESALIDTTAKEVFLPIAASSMDCGCQPCFLWQHGP